MNREALASKRVVTLGYTEESLLSRKLRSRGFLSQTESYVLVASATYLQKMPTRARLLYTGSGATNKGELIAPINAQDLESSWAVCRKTSDV